MMKNPFYCLCGIYTYNNNKMGFSMVVRAVFKSYFWQVKVRFLVSQKF